MENYDVTVHLTDHNYCKRRRTSTRQAERAVKHRPHSKCPCCSNDQVDKACSSSVQSSTQRPQHSDATANPPKKRKRSSVPRLPRPMSPISPEDLPVASNVPPRVLPSEANHQLSSTAVNHDSPVKIHNRSVEEYQHIYHEVVDNMLKYKNGRMRPYSLALGRRIKQKLWERLNRPTITTSVSEDARVHVDVSYGAGAFPPLYEIDTSDEPKPEPPPSKKAK